MLRKAGDVDLDLVRACLSETYSYREDDKAKAKTTGYIHYLSHGID